MSIFDLSPLEALLRTFCLVAAGLILFGGAYAVLSAPRLEPPRYGVRGRRRIGARSEAGFRAIEPWLSRLGGIVARLPLEKQRAWLGRLIGRAGEPMGLCADEWIALSLLSMAVLGGAALWLTTRARMDPFWVVGSVVLSATMPIAGLHNRAKERAKQLERSLPSAMDLCVLCMGAGADFPTALRFVVAELSSTHEICHEELCQVLDELGLGRTRVDALTSLAERTSSGAVREFVAAVCQSETKGTPLVEALDIQSGTLRARRSVLAEEAAAKAGVRLMFPMLLMVVCVLLIILGPFMVTGAGLG